MTNFDEIAQAAREAIGFDSSDICFNGGGRYLRYQLRADRPEDCYKHGVVTISSVGATGRGPDGRLTGRTYVLPKPITLAAGTSVTDERPDFRLLIAALRRVGLESNDADFEGEAPILRGA